MEIQPLVSVVVLAYNGGEMLQRCLDSVLSTDWLNFEIIVVDNASADGSIAHLMQLHSGDPKIKIVKNDSNVGFALGNNIGVRYAKGDYLAFLNQDTVVNSNWLRESVRVMQEDSRIGIVQCKLVKLDDPTIIDSAGHYINTLAMATIRGAGQKDEGQFSRIEEIFGANGAAMVVRRRAFDEAGGFDADYFMMFEESDLCWRSWLLGYRVLFVPKALVYHKGGFSTRRPGMLFHVFYYSRRNKLYSMLRNYEAANLLKYFPFAITIFFIQALLSGQRKILMPACTLALSDVTRNVGRMLVKRHRFQRIRRIQDKALIGSIIRPFTTSDVIKSGAF